MNYFLNPTSKLHYFEHVGGYDDTVQFRLRGEFPICHLGTNKERHDKILCLNSGIMRELMTFATIGGKDRKKMKKSNFLFGDRIELLEDCFFKGNYKWLRQV